MTLTTNDKSYLIKLIAKYDQATRLSKSQQLLLDLGNLTAPSEDDLKNLRVLIRSERNAEKREKEQKLVSKVVEKNLEKKIKALKAEKQELSDAMYKALSENLRFNEEFSYRDILAIMKQQKLVSPALFVKSLLETDKISSAAESKSTSETESNLETKSHKEIKSAAEAENEIATGTKIEMQTETELQTENLSLSFNDAL